MKRGAQKEKYKTWFTNRKISKDTQRLREIEIECEAEDREGKRNRRTLF